MSVRLLSSMLLRGFTPRHSGQPVSQQTDPGPMRSEPQAAPLWIDTDAGVDDSFGIALVHKNTVGIGAVFGNTGSDQVGVNVLRLLTALGSDVPVHMGAYEPLTACKGFSSPGQPYGNDGLGDRPEVWPTAADVKASLSPGHAAVKLVESAIEHDGKLHVLALGPLTNLALALKLDPALPRRIARLVVVGGAQGPGNATPCAEFNFYCDPEAAKLVLAKFANIVLIPYETGKRQLLSRPGLDQILSKPTAAAAFLKGISSPTLSSSDEEGCMMFDPLGAVIATSPVAARSTTKVFCDVETQGEYARGKTVFDWEHQLGRPANVELVGEVDMKLLMQLLDEATD